MRSWIIPAFILLCGRPPPPPMQLAIFFPIPGSLSPFCTKPVIRAAFLPPALTRSASLGFQLQPGMELGHHYICIICHPPAYSCPFLCVRHVHPIRIANNRDSKMLPTRSSLVWPCISVPSPLHEKWTKTLSLSLLPFPIPLQRLKS